MCAAVKAQRLTVTSRDKSAVLARPLKQKMAKGARAPWSDQCGGAGQERSATMLGDMAQTLLERSGKEARGGALACPP